jgi:hypothetical protein
MNTIKQTQKGSMHTLASRPGMIMISGEPRTGIISRLEMQQGMAATHILKSSVITKIETQ